MVYYAISLLCTHAHTAYPHRSRTHTHSHTNSSCEFIRTHLNRRHRSGNIFGDPFTVCWVVSMKNLGNTGNLGCLQAVSPFEIREVAQKPCVQRESRSEVEPQLQAGVPTTAVCIRAPVLPTCCATSWASCPRTSRVMSPLSSAAAVTALSELGLRVTLSCSATTSVDTHLAKFRLRRSPRALIPLLEHLRSMFEEEI